MPVGGLILLDRDGVLNRVVVDVEHGTIDSPMNPSQVEMIPGVPEALKRLNDQGWGLAIVTNQPSAAKGKTTQALLEATHARVVKAAESAGARILSSQICFHRAEDGCTCRKPKPGMLKVAMDVHAEKARHGVWMVGDGVTDIEAGAAAGAKTAFFGPHKCDACKIFEVRRVAPDFWGDSLTDFADHLRSFPIAQENIR